MELETEDFDVDLDAEAAPDFGQLFEEEAGTGPADFSVREFKRPTELGEDPKPFFIDKKFYEKILTGEEDVNRRVHSILGQFLKAEDPQDRSLYRGRLVPAYWDLLDSISARIGPQLPTPKRLVLRYGVLLPTMISQEQRQVIARIIFNNPYGEPVHYVDEWLELVSRGRVSKSAGDETARPRQSDASRAGAIAEQYRGKFEALQQAVQAKARQMQALETELHDHVRELTLHERRDDLGGVPVGYTEAQRSRFTQINQTMRKLSTIARDLDRRIREADDIAEKLEEAEEKEQDLGAAVMVDEKAVTEELGTIRQMHKLCAGKQGNHFPILMKQYFRANIRELGTRENVINLLADYEYLDPGVFLRTFKDHTNRIVPNIILIPSYGESGICWEPFERQNRSTSRGRLAIPMFPKDIGAAVAMALGDLRWQVAKEKAQHYWMEEGLTGRYYQWFTDKKLRGDVKDQFIQDYVLWLTKESEGTQKLDKEVRGIFWRYMPFPQARKDDLRNRGYVYNELYKKDINRSMSAGY